MVLLRAWRVATAATQALLPRRIEMKERYLKRKKEKEKEMKE